MMNRELFHYMSSNNDITRVVVQMHKKNLGFRKAFRCPYNILLGGGCFKICTKNAELNYLHLLGILFGHAKGLEIPSLRMSFFFWFVCYLAVRHM